jgi:hypothetical protein
MRKYQSPAPLRHRAAAGHEHELRARQFSEFRSHADRQGHRLPALFHLLL